MSLAWCPPRRPCEPGADARRQPRASSRALAGVLCVFSACCCAEREPDGRRQRAALRDARASRAGVAAYRLACSLASSSIWGRSASQPHIRRPSALAKPGRSPTAPTDSPSN
ncbi:hypothetical protein ACFPRL_21480 [Pseudoclavibacter helvolus]